MLIAFIAGIYITFLCFSWGLMITRLLAGGRMEQKSASHFSLFCLLGFSVITIFAGYLSLVMPLGGWAVQLLFFIPAVFFFFRCEGKQFFTAFREFKPVSLVLIMAVIVLFLVMNNWKIVHPDTLGYHAQTIQWIENYKAVPGLVHLHTRLGYQGLWFTSSALFSFRFFDLPTVSFLSFPLLMWFTFFVVSKINKGLSEKKSPAALLLWILLLGYCLWNYNLARLTATSASPDFIAVIFILSILYLCIRSEHSDSLFEKNKWTLISLLSFTVITIKLSSIPVILFPIAGIVALLLQKKKKAVLIIMISGIICLIPFIWRNVITTGYFIFPNTSLNIINADWKFDEQKTVDEKNYIKAYARISQPDTRTEMNKILNMGPSEWIPVWWQNRSVPDKTILILFLFSVFLVFIKMKKIKNEELSLVTSLFIMLAGTIFWFIHAPDPRFGMGFIIGFIAVTFLMLMRSAEVNRSATVSVMILFIIAAVAYTGYRFQHFFSYRQWLLPSGIEETHYTTKICHGIQFNYPLTDEDFRNIPVPCTDKKCEEFKPRGMELSDGFRSNP